MGELVVDEVDISGLFNTKGESGDSKSESPYGQLRKNAKLLPDSELCHQATAQSMDGTEIWNYYQKAGLAAVVVADERGLECGIGKPVFPKDLAEYYAGGDVHLPH